MRPLAISKFFMSVMVPLGLFVGTFLVQIRLGYDVAMFPLYMFAVATLTWSRGFAGGLLAVTASTLLWYFGAVLTNYTFSHSWALAYNVCVRALLFGSTSYFILAFKRVVEQHRQRMEGMRALLNICHGCGAMQDGRGNWFTLDEQKNLTNRPPCECPTCEAAVRDRLLK